MPSGPPSTRDQGSTEHRTDGEARADKTDEEAMLRHRRDLALCGRGVPEGLGWMSHFLRHFLIPNMRRCHKDAGRSGALYRARHIAWGRCGDLVTEPSTTTCSVGPFGLRRIRGLPARFGAAMLGARRDESCDGGPEVVTYPTRVGAPPDLRAGSAGC